MCNSGYKEDQIRRIVIAGIRGWGGKISRCKAEGRRIRRTSKDSLEARTRTNLLGKSTWFKKPGGPRKDWYGKKGGKKGSKGEAEKPKTTTTMPRSVLFK